MIYILVALKAEAQAFVDKYKLLKYKNKDIHIIISGIGADNMKKTTENILKNIKSGDKLLNVGICGASKNYEIGQVIDGFEENITCVDYEISTKDKYEIVDMESSGFIEASKKFTNRYMYKVVSDHFEPKTVTKDKAKKLIFDNIDEILNLVQNDKDDL